MGLHRARIDECLIVVAEMHNLSRADLKSNTRRHAVSHPRHEAMYLAREMTGQSYPQLARAFGGLDHTSVLFGVRKITARIGDDPKLAERMNICRAKVAELVAERISKFMATHATSSDWSPPPPTAHISKPSTVVLTIDQISWLALGGEVVA